MASGCKHSNRNLVLVGSAHSALIPASLMIGHYFSASAFTNAPSASGVCCSGGKISWPRSASRDRTAGSASAAAHLSPLLRRSGAASSKAAPLPASGCHQCGDWSQYFPPEIGLEAWLREQPVVRMRRSISSSPLPPSCCRALVDLACSDFDFSTFRFHVPISGLLCADATCGNDAIPNPKSISISMVRRFTMFLPGTCHRVPHRRE